MKKLIFLFFSFSILSSVTVSALPPAGSFYAQGSKDRKAVALTFDDGPGKYTQPILTVLKENNVKATFFMEAQQIEFRPNIAKAVLADGHEIGGHSYSHPNFYSYKNDDKEELLGREIEKASAIMEKVLGKKPVIMRMPHGYVRPWVKEVAKNHGVILVNWSFGCDWQKMTAQEVTAAYIKNIKPGAIFLMHDGGAKRDNTLAALPALIAELKKKGYEILTVGELLGITP